MKDGSDVKLQLTLRKIELTLGLGLGGLRTLRLRVDLEGHTALEAAGLVFVDHIFLGGLVSNGSKEAQLLGGQGKVTARDSSGDTLAIGADAAFDGLVPKRAGLRLADGLFGGLDVGHKNGGQKRAELVVAGALLVKLWNSKA